MGAKALARLEGFPDRFNGVWNSLCGFHHRKTNVIGPIRCEMARARGVDEAACGPNRDVGIHQQPFAKFFGVAKAFRNGFPLIDRCRSP